MTSWTNINTIIVLNDSNLITKCASFDMDDTLITTKSGAKHALDRTDWVWLNDKVVPTLKSLVNDGFTIVIFSNQGGITKGHTKEEDIKGKINDLIAASDVPMKAVISTCEDQYRKPGIDMWKYICGTNTVSLQDSFYVGDAAGRQKNWKKGAKKDFSCSDRKFAANIGIKFLTPEEFFLKEPATPFVWDSIEPTKIPRATTVPQFIPSTKPEMIIMCGFPAAGKSTFVKKYVVPNGYVYVNRDTMNKNDKCIKAARDAANSGKSVVIDNTNPDKETRSIYIDIAKAANMLVRCFYMTTPIEITDHLNLYREKTQGIKRIPDIAFNMCKKKFVEPTLAEGFSEVNKIEFLARFDSANEEEEFNKWT